MTEGATYYVPDSSRSYVPNFYYTNLQDEMTQICSLTGAEDWADHSINFANGANVNNTTNTTASSTYPHPNGACLFDDLSARDVTDGHERDGVTGYALTSGHARRWH